LPFQGHAFVKTEVRDELNTICSDHKYTAEQIWEWVVARFNNATKAKNFVKALSVGGVKSTKAMMILRYYDGRLADITSSNASAKAVEAEVLWNKGNVLIPSYFSALVGATDAHRSGTFVPELGPGEVKTRSTIDYRRYANAERYLPAGNDYIEWYSSGSTGKRFFTVAGKTEVWFTDGGTHGAADFWHNPNPATDTKNWTRNLVAE
jgi:hypothetical protein